MDIVFNTIGFAGTLAIVIAYFLQQHGTVTGTSAIYLWTNFVGSSAMLISLLWFWNMPSVVLQCIWLIITGQSLLKRKAKSL